MMREKVGPVITLLLASLIIGCSIGFSARAGADPEDTVQSYALRNAAGICSLLLNSPDTTGVEDALGALKAAGMTDGRLALAVTVIAVDSMCPQYLPVVSAYTVQGPPVTAAVGPMGGRIG